MIVLGLMSGTSMDGLDCCLSDIKIDEFNNIKFNILDYKTYSYSTNIKNRIIESINNKNYADINKKLGRFFLEKSIVFLKNKEIDLIASHGQTVSHVNKKYSIQIGNPKFLKEHFKVPVLYDFRKNDILNNGTGAPLVPFLDWILFENEKTDILTLNIGGISNITYIPLNKDKNSIIGFDTGPGMCLVDLFVRRYWNKNFDKDGYLSTKGKICTDLLNFLFKNNYIQKPPPKSDSVENYNWVYLINIIKKFNNINKYDFLRTLVNFTACTIKKNIDLFIASNKQYRNKIFISGGGVKNKVLVNDLRNMIKDYKINTINYNGINIDNKESFLMCLLGFTSFNNIPNNIPSVTGADKEVICGIEYE